jgi:hypothetical protein
MSSTGRIRGRSASRGGDHSETTNIDYIIDKIEPRGFDKNMDSIKQMASVWSAKSCLNPNNYPNRLPSTLTLELKY